MLCPKCGEKSCVTDTVGAPTKTYRRRKCKVCEHVFYSEEIAVEPSYQLKLDWNTYARHSYCNRNKKEK